MARTSGGGGSNKRLSLPSAAEMLNIVGKTISQQGTDFSGPQTSVSKVRVNDTEDIFRDNSNFNSYKPTQYTNWAGEKYQTDEGTAPERTTYELINFNSNMNVQQLDNAANWKIPGYQPDEAEDSSPAPLTLIPTSTTNPDRPRTVAAGYDSDEEKLTVMFRDGTLYNYYEVNQNEWNVFKANRSKGAVIHSMLDFKPRGYADDSSMSKKAREAFYRFSRGSQIYSQGKEKGQSKSTYKTNAQAIKSSRKGKNPSKGGKNSYKKG
jgi:hypothetical protein